MGIFESKPKPRKHLFDTDSPREHHDLMDRMGSMSTYSVSHHFTCVWCGEEVRSTKETILSGKLPVERMYCDVNEGRDL